MSIEVKFRLGDVYDLEDQSISIDAEDSLEIAEVWKQLSGLDVDPLVLCSKNQTVAQYTELVSSGDSITFFVALTGG